MMRSIATAVTEIAMFIVLSGGSGCGLLSTSTIVRSVCSRNFFAALIVMAVRKYSKIFYSFTVSLLVGHLAFKATF